MSRELPLVKQLMLTVTPWHTFGVVSSKKLTVSCATGKERMIVNLH